MREPEKHRPHKSGVLRHEPHRHSEREKRQQAREREEHEEIIQGFEDELSEFEDDYDLTEPDDEDITAPQDRSRPKK